MSGPSPSVKAWAKYSTGEYFMNNFISVRRINVDLWDDREKSDSLSIQKMAQFKTFQVRVTFCQFLA